MTARIRPFAPEDYPALAAIGNACYPEYAESEEELRYGDRHRDPQVRQARWIAEQDGTPVGVGEYGQSAGRYHPRKFHVQVMVLPERQGQGIGRRLYETVAATLESFAPLSLRANVREDMGRSVRFLEDRGYREQMRSWESRLDVAAFDPSPYAGHEERVRAGGIEIATLAELLERDPDCARKTYRLHQQLEEDVPGLDPPTPQDFDTWLRRRLEGPSAVPEAHFVALDGEAYVGCSALWKTPASDDLYTGLTGVVRAYRRRGIALALKLRGIAWAKTRGCPVLKTWNESNNRPMLSINERLGFVRQPAWIDYVKALREEQP